VGVNWTGSFLVPKWACVFVAGMVLLFTPFLVTLGLTAIEQLAAFDRAAERRLLMLRASQLKTQALAAGSPLACLDTVAGEVLQPSCEKALFSNAEATAAALSYVATQLSLLEIAKRLQVSGDLLADVRRAVEIDRFGLVAQVLAASYGCSPQACEWLGLLEDSRRVRANLVEGLFAAHAKKYVLEPATSTAAVQTVQTPPPSVPVAKPSSGLYLPSAASIPPISIMTAEPGLRTEGSEAKATNAQRKPAAGKEEARASAGVNSGGIQGAPLQLSPAAQ
jgi:hypothetical protein